MATHSHTQQLTSEERAFFAKLMALNTAFEAARAGKAAEHFSQRAEKIDAVLDRYFLALSHDFANREVRPSN